MSGPTPIAVVPWLTGSSLGPVFRVLEHTGVVAHLADQIGDPRPLAWTLRHVAALGASGSSESAFDVQSILELPREGQPGSLAVAGFPGSVEEFGPEADPLWRVVLRELWKELGARLSGGKSFYAESAPLWLSGVLGGAGLESRQLVVVEDPRSIAARLWRSRVRAGRVPAWLGDPASAWSLVEQTQEAFVPQQLSSLVEQRRENGIVVVRVEDCAQDAERVASSLRSWLEGGESPALVGSGSPSVEGLPPAVVEAIGSLFGDSLKEFGYEV